jgi:hypothetical protein
MKVVYPELLQLMESVILDENWHSLYEIERVLEDKQNLAISKVKYEINRRWLWTISNLVFANEIPVYAMTPLLPSSLIHAVTDIALHLKENLLECI